MFRQYAVKDSEVVHLKVSTIVPAVKKCFGRFSVLFVICNSYKLLKESRLYVRKNVGMGQMFIFFAHQWQADMAPRHVATKPDHNSADGTKFESEPKQRQLY